MTQTSAAKRRPRNTPTAKPLVSQNELRATTFTQQPFPPCKIFAAESGRKKLVFDEQADGVVDGQVEFLNFERSLGWDADTEVAERGEFPAAFTGQAENLESPRPRDFGSGTDIGRGQTGHNLFTSLSRAKDT